MISKYFISVFPSFFCLFAMCYFFFYIFLWSFDFVNVLEFFLSSENCWLCFFIIKELSTWKYLNFVVKTLYKMKLFGKMSHKIYWNFFYCFFDLSFNQKAAVLVEQVKIFYFEYELKFLENTYTLKFNVRKKFAINFIENFFLN